MKRPLYPRALLLLLLAFAGCQRVSSPPLNHSAQTNNELTIAAAANVKDVLDEAARQFEAETKTKVTISAGSTGYLATQIEAGAPFDLFVSADVKTVARLIAAGRLDAATHHTYARGRLVLWTPASLSPVKTLAELAQPSIKKIALAQPDLAPYGQAAIESLTASHLLERVRGKLVYGENVGQTLQFAETGNAQVAFVSLSLTRRYTGHFFIVDEKLHQPIDQALAVVAGSHHAEAAHRFIQFLLGERGRQLFTEYGYGLP